MNLTTDSYNSKNAASYWIQIFYLPSPDFENSSKYPLFVNFYIANKNMNSVLYAVSPSLTKTSVAVSFIEPTATTKALMWYRFNNDALIQAKIYLYEQYTGRPKHVYVQAFRGIVSDRVIYLSLLNNAYFNKDFSFYFTNSTVILPIKLQNFFEFS